MMVRGWPRGLRRALTWVAMVSLALLGAGTLSAILGAPTALAAPASASQRAIPAHALLVRSDPSANQILAAPPSQVKAWFSEPVNPNTSSLVVIDPSNHEVDTHDSHVSASNSQEMIVGLQLLRPGTYIVVWRTQSAVDGHIAGGSFIFRVANADGSVPPVPAKLPTSATPGAAGYGANSTTLDGPTWAQAAFDWLALLFASFWVGGVIWQTWIAPTSVDMGGGDEGARLAGRRFRRLAPYALGGLLLANLGYAAALTIEIAGGARGLVEGRFWAATIFSGQFAAYWWMRQVIAAAALGLALFASHADGASRPSDLTPQPPLLRGEGELTWTQELVATLRQIPQLPRRLWRGWLALHVVGQIEVALGLLLLFAFTMSGHAAATPPNERAYAVTIDVLHLLFNAAWLGGLLYISVVLIPAAHGLSERARAVALARGVPAFSALAIVSAAFLTLTGSLNATVRLTTASQLIMTAYGRTLVVKTELFLIMCAISAYHAFHLRPRLAAALAEEKSAVVAVAMRGWVEHPVPQSPAAEEPKKGAADAPLSRAARGLAARMEDWLRREALLGVGVLACVGLLSVFSGTLTTSQLGIVASSAFSQTQTLSGYKIALNVSPASFGSNTFTVTVTDPQGKADSHVSVLLLTDSLDMNMGEQTLQLQPAGSSQPGVYTATGDLTMAGHWQITVKVLPQGASDYLTTKFKLLAGS